MTIDHGRAGKPAKGTLPDFAPVPRLCNRHDGWTPERQRGFIEALAETGSVKAAAHAVNMTPEGAYLLRRHAEGGEFRQAWQAALKLGIQRLEDVALERALHGVEVPVYHFGAVVGVRRVYNDRLLMFMLRNRATRRFAADGLHRADACTRQQLAKLKRQWREEWEAEQRHDEQDVYDQLDQMIDQMRERSRIGITEEELRLEAELEAARARRPALAWYGDDDDEGEEDGGDEAGGDQDDYRVYRARNSEARKNETGQDETAEEDAAEEEAAEEAVAEQAAAEAEPAPTAARPAIRNI
jgi:hypothetical protein